MSSRYQKQFPIPEGFPTLLKDFAREILRNQPRNIYEFGATYFADLLKKSQNPDRGDPEQAPAAAGEPVNATPSQPQNEFAGLLMKHFREADAEGTGMLRMPRVKQILAGACGEYLQLSYLQLISLLSEARPDEFGMVNYAEFCPIAADLAQQMMDPEVRRQHDEAVAMMSSTGSAQLLRGLTLDGVENIIMGAFEAADADRSGSLNYEEVLDALKSLGASEIRLSPNEIALLIGAVDENEDGRVQYPELLGFMLEALVYSEHVGQFSKRR
eukprot:jgi/Mesvir1/17616/Mv08842-RA.1